MPINDIVIMGGGVAGWLTALTLACKTNCAITLVDTGGTDDSLGIPCAIEPTLPSIAALHDLLDLDSVSLAIETGSSFALGRALSNWTKASAVAFHAYGEVGASLGPMGFQHLVARLRHQGQAINFANYSVNALSAQSGRFAPPPANSRSVLSTMAFGLHLNIAEYRTNVQQQATARGVTTHQGCPSNIILDADGLIATIALDNGTSITGDLFIDCSGQSRLLMRCLPPFPYEDWSRWLPCDQARSNLAPAIAPPLYTHIDAHQMGWHRFTSTQSAVEEVFLSAGQSSDGYMFQSGRLAESWVGNCIAIGGSAAIIDPIASTQMHLATQAICRLLRLFPHDRHGSIERSEFNRQTAEEQENARDFAIFHYKCNARAGDAFWDDCRAMAVPDRLAHKIALYESCGRIALHDEESFEAWDWIAAFDAFGILPRSYDHLANGIAMQRIEAHLAQVRAIMLKAVETMPMQHDFLKTRKTVNL